MVPDRVALQVQRQVLSRLAAAVLRLPEHEGRAEDRAGRARGGGVPGLAAAPAALGGAEARPGQAQAPAAPGAPGGIQRAGNPHVSEPRPGAPGSPPIGGPGGYGGAGSPPVIGGSRGVVPPDRHSPPVIGGSRGVAPPDQHCLVMGVVNVTPDSFSDGGQWYGADAAIAHGLELAAQGADIVDVGGESTRPGAQRISQEEELRRIGPVVTELVRAGLPVSIDTMRAPVAEFALNAGVQLVNDVSGGLADPDMPRLVAAAGVSFVVVHWRGHSHDMYSRAVYADVVAEVRDELARRVDAVVHAGVDPGRIVLDPGLGFGKRPEHNWPLLTHLAEIGTLAGRSFPVLVGASRKRFLGNLLAGPDGTPRPFAECDGATVAITALAAAAGAWCVRVHQVPLNADAVRVAAAWRDAAGAGAAGPPQPVARAVTGRS